MYKQIDKNKMSGNIATADIINQRKSNGKQAVGLLDNRTTIINGNDVISGSSRKAIQRAVPTVQNLNPHPTPETGTYKAASGHHEIFNSKDYPRSRFSFGKYTRNEVLEKFPHMKVGHRVAAVKDSASGQMVNVEGIQLDHHISWDKIASVMNNDGNYSFYEAKMYYNDQSNLHPVLGGLNAAAGSSGVKMMEEQFPEINAKVASIQTSWMNLQNYINARLEEVGIDPTSLLDYLERIEERIDETLEY